MDNILLNKITNLINMNVSPARIIPNSRLLPPSSIIPDLIFTISWFNLVQSNSSQKVYFKLLLL